MKNMLLAIDIGNTNISLGVFKGRRILKRYSIPTKQNRCLKYLKKIFNKHNIDNAIICSVVPKKTAALNKDLSKLLGKKPIIIGKDVLVPIKNLYRQPKQVGQDRLVNAYAGTMFFGAPLIVIDFGTAITFDVISRKKEYLGGLILPGLQIALDALADRTALLPKIKLSQPKGLIGADTKNSMLSGIIYGFAMLSDSLTAKIRHIIGKDAKIIGTGGDIGLMRDYCKFTRVDNDLTLKGLQLIYVKKALSFT